ncbi:GDP-mannose 4,6-dehydratase [Williamsia sterculiae]|uniref:GDP-mannose 4,6-dehydratase n=1 Tax=Williamsia sterculiae TaxID=1344003 RepID=A0A1N7CZ80_9NOCA|nr:GDP-mannose 4,6-dehydratase [Williamsia sterculiae]SIR68946.1 GDPmannose 4,6-dehydratase [Williamsia sterculiae]
MTVSDDGRTAALITGVGGQDGGYLAELLAADGWMTHGVVRPGRPDGAAHAVRAGAVVHEVDITDARAMTDLIEVIRPAMVFHLAANSSVASSWEDTYESVNVNGVSIAPILDACLNLQSRTGHRVSVVNASSAEIFAGSGVHRQDEGTPIVPTSPYGAAKAFGHHLVQIYRSRGLVGSNAILFNHESPRRPDRFVTRKITRGVAEIASGVRDTLALGNTDVRRDWGWAPDYARAMFEIGRRGVADDFVLATGEAHSVSDLVAAAFAAAGITDWQPYVMVDPDLFRPADAEVMIGDATKARGVLDWSPTHTFGELVADMVDADLAELRQSRIEESAR